jgi:carbon-monoxide dehydrogenase large subunit
VTDPVAGLEPNSPRARLDCPSNLVAQHKLVYGNARRHSPQRRIGSPCAFVCTKGGGHSIEPRGVVARYDANEDLLPSSTRRKCRTGEIHTRRGARVHENRLRVIAPDVGGGFGPKAVFHPEELAIPAAALALGRTHQMDRRPRRKLRRHCARTRQDWDMEAAFDAEGRLLAMRGHMRHDHGANTPYGVALPTTQPPT